MADNLFARCISYFRWDYIHAWTWSRVCVCACVREGERVCMLCMGIREKERESGWVSEWVEERDSLSESEKRERSVCMCECVCKSLCVCLRERERERIFLWNIKSSEVSALSHPLHINVFLLGFGHSLDIKNWSFHTFHFTSINCAEFL